MNLHTDQRSFSERIIDFYLNVARPVITIDGFTVMDPFRSAEVRRVARDFYSKFYSDNRRRLFVIGINPGRFGGGLTGIPFTDPWALQELCEIPSLISGKRELSSEFIYEFIDRFGGVERFFGNCYLTAALPFGLLRGNVNVNYYDDRTVLAELDEYIVKSMRRQVEFGARRDVAIVLGGGKNYRELLRLNNEHRFFDRLVPLDHPRFIMQYRRKRLDEYLRRYVDTVNEALGIQESPEPG